MDASKQATDGRGSQSIEERMAALERRVSELEDVRALQELLAQYSFNADLVDRRPRWVDLWTPDGLYDLGPHRPGNVRDDSYQGEGRLLELITGSNMPPPNSSQHHASHPAVFRINGDEAVAYTYSMTVLKENGEVKPWNLGFRRWHFKRIDGTWRIAACFKREVDSPEAAAVIEFDD